MSPDREATPSTGLFAARRDRSRLGEIVEANRPETGPGPIGSTHRPQRSGRYARSVHAHRRAERAVT